MQLLTHNTVHQLNAIKQHETHVWESVGRKLIEYYTANRTMRPQNTVAIYSKGYIIKSTHMCSLSKAHGTYRYAAPIVLIYLYNHLSEVWGPKEYTEQDVWPMHSDSFYP